MRDADGVLERPNDSRGFIHKKILGLGGKILGTVSNIPGVSLLPGAGLVRTAGQVARSFGRSRPAPPPQIVQPPIGIGTQATRFPGANPLETQVEARKFAGTFPKGNGNGTCPPEPGVCAPRGFHLNKSSYFLRNGTFVERGSIFVRNRRLNNANGRAQDKAIVRLEKGQDHAKKLLKATGWRTISKMSSREMRNAKKAVCK